MRPKRPVTATFRPKQASPEASAGKSARRMFEILELFGSLRRPLSVREIGDRLGYPNSSASVLVKTAAEMGYLSYDLKSRTYVATLRLATLGAWVYEGIPSGDQLTSVVREVADRTRETVVVAAENDIYSQYVHVTQSTHLIQYNIPPGHRVLMCHSGTGWAMLSKHDDERIERLVHRTKVRLGKAVEFMRKDDVLARVQEVRTQGYAWSQGAVAAGGALIAVPISLHDTGDALALGVAATQERMEQQKDEVLAIIREAVAKLELPRGLS